MNSVDVLNHGVQVNLANWAKYLSSSDENAVPLLREICEEVRSQDQVITRGYVRDTFTVSLPKGIIASVVWGYPKGRFPGGRSFAGIFSQADMLARKLAWLREGEPLPANDICRQFDGFRGIGPSTYTKILYFAGVDASEGMCLIYDQMVMRSIAESSEAQWADIRAKLGPCRQHGKFKPFARAVHEGTYGAFLRAAHGASTAQKSADCIEIELFMTAPRGRATQHSLG